jgi:hypothetical protein
MEGYGSEDGHRRDGGYGDVGREGRKDLGRGKTIFSEAVVTCERESWNQRLRCCCISETRCSGAEAEAVSPMACVSGGNMWVLSSEVSCTRKVLGHP